MAELIEAIEAGKVRALSIRQPWCHHILHDGKDVENRDWPTRYRGWFLIHAGKASDGTLPLALADVPRGGIVGAARITDCVSSSDSYWWMGKFGFVLTDAMPIPLVECKGALGFFMPEPQVIAQVIQWLTAARTAREGGALPTPPEPPVFDYKTREKKRSAA